MSLRDLQKSILPNIPLLRGLIGWFDAISDAIDDLLSAPSDIYASGRVTAGGSFDDSGAQRAGFAQVIGHSTPGIYSLTLVHPVVNPNLYVIQATLTYLGATVDRVESIGASFQGNDTIRVQVRSVTDNAGVPEFAQTDHDFFVTVTRLLPPETGTFGTPG